MKTLFFWLFVLNLLIPKCSWEQISYTPVFIDSCSLQVVHCFWYLSDNDNRYDPSLYDTRHVELPKAGTYRLHFNSDLDIFEELNIPNKGEFVDTHYLSKLMFNTYTDYTEYTYCDNLAEGELIGYYPNGQIKIKGTFSDGQPISKVYEYFPNGVILKVSIPHKKGLRTIHYYENGQVKFDKNEKKEIELQYYENGELTYKSINSGGRNYKEMSYYPNSVLKSIQKSRRYEYYNAQGILLEKIERKFIGKGRELLPLKREEREPKLYQFNWTSYDSVGTIKRSIDFQRQVFLHHGKAPNLTHIEAYNFEKVVFYSEGSPTIMILNPHQGYRATSRNNLIIYENIDGVWFEIKREHVDQIHELIALYSA